MALVWQCARCGTTDPGTDDQREGRQPPSDWLTIYRPHTADLNAKAHQDYICGACKSAFYGWLHPREA